MKKQIAKQIKMKRNFTRKMRRPAAFVLACALAAGLLSISGTGQTALADDTETETETLTYTYEGVTFTYEAADDAMTITGTTEDTSSCETLVLPEEIDDLAVTAVGDAAFYEYAALTSVTLPDSITEIGSTAFYGCSSLTGIDLPDGLDTLGSSAFNGCSKLETIDLPDGIKSIEASTFKDCTSLESVDFPSELTSIGQYAFYDCQELTEVLFPDGLLTIGTYAFANCTDITYILLPANEVTINDYNFSQSTNIDTVEYAEGATRPYTQSTWLLGETFVDYVHKLVLPSTITSLSTGASGDESNNYFIFFESLEEVEISEDNPDYATYDGCIYDKDLTSLYVVPKAVTEIEFAPTCDTIAKGSFAACAYITEIIVPETVTTIESGGGSSRDICGPFYACLLLEKLEIPETVTSIGDQILSDYPCLNDLSFYLDGVYYHFTGESSITQMEIADGSEPATEVTDAVFELFDTEDIMHTFYGNSSKDLDEIEVLLESVVLPASTTSIQSDLFEDMTALTSITVADGNSAYYSSDGVLYEYAEDGSLALLRYPRALGYVDFADNVTSFGERAFYGCSELSSIDGPETLTEIGTQTFYGLMGMEYDFTASTGLTTIGDGAFYAGYNSTVKLPASVSSIGENAFYTLDASLTLYCYQGSYADTYAQANGITCEYYSEDTSDTEDTSNNSSNNSSNNASGSTSKAAVGSKVTVGKGIYKITSSNTVTYMGASKKNLTKVTIPAKVKINGKTYKVTKVNASALAKSSKLKTVVIGKNVTSIGKKAFYNCKNLKKITCKGSKIKTIGSKAFKGVSKKATVKVPKAKKTKYKKLLKKAGLPAAAKVK